MGDQVNRHGDQIKTSEVTFIRGSDGCPTITWGRLKNRLGKRDLEGYSAAQLRRGQLESQLVCMKKNQAFAVILVDQGHGRMSLSYTPAQNIEVVGVGGSNCLRGKFRGEQVVGWLTTKPEPPEKKSPAEKAQRPAVVQVERVSPPAAASAAALGERVERVVAEPLGRDQQALARRLAGRSQEVQVERRNLDGGRTEIRFGQHVGTFEENNRMKNWDPIALSRDKLPRQHRIISTLPQEEGRGVMVVTRTGKNSYKLTSLSDNELTMEGGKGLTLRVKDRPEEVAIGFLVQPQVKFDATPSSTRSDAIEVVQRQAALDGSGHVLLDSLTEAVAASSSGVIVGRRGSNSTADVMTTTNGRVSSEHLLFEDNGEGRIKVTFKGRHRNEDRLILVDQDGFTTDYLPRESGDVVIVTPALLRSMRFTNTHDGVETTVFGCVRQTV